MFNIYWNQKKNVIKSCETLNYDTERSHAAKTSQKEEYATLSYVWKKNPFFLDLFGGIRQSTHTLLLIAVRQPDKETVSRTSAGTNYSVC